MAPYSIQPNTITQGRKCQVEEVNKNKGFNATYAINSTFELFIIFQTLTKKH